MLQMFLSSWVDINKALPSLREDQLKELINMERQGKARKAFLDRMHQRYCKLRSKRERAELDGGKLL